MDLRRNMASAGPTHLIFLLDLSIVCSGKIILVLNSLYLLLNVDTQWANWNNYVEYYSMAHMVRNVYV